MVCSLNPVTVVNFSLCALIFILGYVGYTKSQDKIALYIGSAFGLFGISHLITIFCYKPGMEGAMLVIRGLGYLIIIFALAKAIVKR